MVDFEAMSIGELKRHREELQRQIEGLRDEFVAAGMVLEAKRQDTPKARALRKLSEAQAELNAALTEASAEEVDLG